jgi:hypothetical protein
MDNDKDIEEGRTEEDVEIAYAVQEHVSGALDVEIEETSREGDTSMENAREDADMELFNGDAEIEMIDSVDIEVIENTVQFNG